MYGIFGYVHAALWQARRRLRSELGQGTVEYVALILLVALVMAGVVAAMQGFETDDGQALGDAIITKIKQAVQRVKF
jgi:Flp pilus assembly pilin Flp